MEGGGERWTLRKRKSHDDDLAAVRHSPLWSRRRGVVQPGARVTTKGPIDAAAKIAIGVIVAVAVVASLAALIFFAITYVGL